MAIRCCKLFCKLISSSTAFYFSATTANTPSAQAVADPVNLLTSLLALASWVPPSLQRACRAREGAAPLRGWPWAAPTLIGGAQSHVTFGSGRGGLAPAAVLELPGDPWEPPRVDTCAWGDTWWASPFVPVTWLHTSQTRWGGAGACWLWLHIGNLSSQILRGTNVASCILSNFPPWWWVS